LRVTVYSEFSDIPRELYARCSYPRQPDFLSSIEWFQCLFENSLPENDSLRAYFVTGDDGAARAALFCVYTQNTRRLRSLTNFYTTEYAPIEFDDASNTNQAWQELADYILGERPAWQAIEFRMLRSEDGSGHPLFARLSDAGFFIYQYPFYDNWFTSVQGTNFDSYYQGLSSRVRNTIRRKAKKLDEQFSVRVRIYRDQRDDLATGIRDYVEVYNSSWKKPEPYANFIPSLAKTCGGCGTLLLGILYVDNRPVAAQFWVITGKKAIIYKLAYVQQHSNYSPGSILSKALFEVAIDEYRPLIIDYGIGSEPYKRDWMDQCRSVYALHGYNTRTMAGLLNTMIYRAKCRFKLLMQAIGFRQSEQSLIK